MIYKAVPGPKVISITDGNTSSAASDLLCRTNI